MYAPHENRQWDEGRRDGVVDSTAHVHSNDSQLGLQVVCLHPG
jgi:hypothetical protein